MKRCCQLSQPRTHAVSIRVSPEVANEDVDIDGDTLTLTRFNPS